MTTHTASFDVRRGDERTFQRADGVLSRFSFAFAGNFDLAAGAHGALMVHNDDIVDGGGGFEPHHHSEAEVVTWVIDGALAHEDSIGNSGVVEAGQLQRMTAGRGIRHAERNASRREKVRVVQMWLAPDTPGLEPGYEHADLAEALSGGELVTALSGRPGEDGHIGIANRWVALDIARPRPGAPVTVAGAPFHHVYVTRGSLTLRPVATVEASGDEADEQTEITLSEGDALRATAAGPLEITATGDEPAEVLVWRMHAHF